MSYMRKVKLQKTHLRTELRCVPSSFFVFPLFTSIVQIYKELALQKKEKEDRANVNAPKIRDYELEHAEAVEKQRSVEKLVEER
jgi:hypothetical protein